jgi:hypothetical protein
MKFKPKFVDAPKKKKESIISMCNAVQNVRYLWNVFSYCWIFQDTEEWTEDRTVRHLGINFAATHLYLQYRNTVRNEAGLVTTSVKYFHFSLESTIHSFVPWPWGHLRTLASFLCQMSTFICYFPSSSISSLSALVNHSLRHPSFLNLNLCTFFPPSHLLWKTFLANWNSVLMLLPWITWVYYN